MIALWHLHSLENFQLKMPIYLHSYAPAFHYKVILNYLLEPTFFLVKAGERCSHMFQNKLTFFVSVRLPLH